MSRARDLLTRLLARAGVAVDGPEPWDLRVRDERVFARVVADGSLGMGDSYVDGWWECDRIDELIRRVLSTDVEEAVKPGIRTAIDLIHAKLINRQTRKGALEIVAHYDVGNAFYERLLGPSMVYSCAYWPRAATLDEAQEHKLDLVCRKLHLAAGERMIDFGSGWGGLVRHAAARYGARATGVTLSREQHAWAEEKRVEGARYLLADYRSRAVRRLGRFDKIASVGMMEHVGRRNYRRFFEQVYEQLEDQGLFLLHTIGTAVSTDETDPWIEKRIFPGSVLASMADIAKAAEGLFVIEDVHNFALDYARTLRCWYENLEGWREEGSDTGGERGGERFPFDERFYRTWRYYLLAFSGCFAARRTIQLWQVVLSRRGARGAYLPVR